MKGFYMDKERKTENNEARKKSLFREYFEAALIAILLALFIRTFVVQAFKIPSGSMEPTLLVGDHILVNKFIYGIKIPFTDHYILRIKKPERGDIAVFKWPRDEKKDFIKRVIGVAGDKVEIKDDALYLNDKKIEIKYIGTYKDNYVNSLSRYLEFFKEGEHYIIDEYSKHENFGPVVVPEDSIFAMGDNRDNSHDSRYWGFVSLRKLKGKAMIVYWSWPSWRRFGHLIR